EDPIAKAKAIAAKLALTMGGAAAAAGAPAEGMDSELGKRKGRWGEETALPTSVVLLGVELTLILIRILTLTSRSKIEIPTDSDINYMGVLIGPRGSTLKHLESQSGAKICIRGRGSQKNPTPGDPNNDEPLHVLVEGSEEACSEASKLIQGILQNPAEAQRIKVSTQYTVCCCSGAGGHYGPPAGGYMGAGAAGGGGPEEEMPLSIPNSMVGVLIGKGGENVQRMQREFGIKIEISKAEDMAPGQEERPVTLKGPREYVTCLLPISSPRDEGMSSLPSPLANRIFNILGVLLFSAPSRMPGLTLMPWSMAARPCWLIGRVIGRQGNTIKGLQQRNDCNIQVPATPDSDDATMRTITVSAPTRENAERCVGEINTVMQAGPGGGPALLGALPGQSTLYVQIPTDRVGLVIGKAGATIKELQSRTGARIQIPMEADPGTNVRSVSITGAEQACAHAKYEIEMMCSGYSADAFNQNADPYQQPQQPTPYSYMAPQAAYGYAADPYAQQHAAYGQQAAYGQPGAYGQPAYGQPAAQPAYGQQAPATGAAAAAAPAPAATDMSQYHEQFWQYAAYYGERVAREQYTVWAPPVGKVHDNNSPVSLPSHTLSEVLTKHFSPPFSSPPQAPHHHPTLRSLRLELSILHLPNRSHL
ncbi:unnamed protein product, partial [Chrysoparadoxa australica]